MSLKKLTVEVWNPVAKRYEERELLQIHRDRNITEKTKTVEVTATSWPPGRPKILGPLVQKRIYNLPFMKAMEKAQREFVGASLSIRTLGWAPPKEEQAAPPQEAACGG